MAKIKIDPKRLEGANERAEERIAHTRALRTERADEADKLLTPSETRLHRAALEMERADERDKMLVPSASRAARADERDKSNMPSFTRQVMSTMTTAPSAPTSAAKPGESLSDFAARQKLYEIALADERDKRNTASMTDVAKSIKPLQRESTPEPFHLARGITSAAAKLYAGSQLGAAGNAVYGSSLRNAEQASGDIAAWKDTINAYRDVLNDRESTESERATANAVIGDLTRRINAYQTAYGTGGVTQQAARRMEDFADRITESGARDVERAQQGMDRVGRWLVGSSVSGLQMGADAAIGVLTGLPAIVPMLTRSFGGGVQEARQKGYNHEQQMALGLANAATEYFTEKLFGGNPVYDDDVGLVNMLVGKLTGNTRLLRALDSLPADMISEGLEEVAADLLNPLSELAATGNWTGYDIDGIIDSFVTGFLTSGVANVGAGITNTVLGSERTASDEELREELVRRIMTNQDAVDSLQRGGLATITDDMSKAERKAEIARAVERLNGQENSAATGTRPAQRDNLTREANRGAEARISAPVRSAADFDGMTARNVTAEQAAADVKAATRNADLLGRNGARMFRRYYDEDMARYLSPADATEAYGAVYQAALAGREAPQVNAPKVLAEAARIAGENDRRDAAQAQYFGKDAGFVADTNKRGANLTAKDVRTLDALFKTLGVRGTMADTLVSRDEDGNLVGNNAMIENGRMTLARDAEDPVRVASVHESVHRIRQAAPEAYSEMARFVIDHMSDERLASTLREHNARYAGLSESEITEEMVADAYGVILGESDMLDSLVTQHRSAAQRLFDAIRDIIDRIKKALRKDSGAQLSDEQREAFRDLHGREEEMARLLGKALERTRERAAEATKFVGEASTQSEAEASEIKYSRVSDKETLDMLNSGDTVKVYRAMQVIDGKLYPPMAAKVAEESGGKRQLVESTDFGVWYRSDERPDLVDPKTHKFKLDKANGAAIEAAYNPYFHTSATPLNDQFSSAYKRPNLVTVEVEIPKSELTSGYKAEFAKDSVGETKWHAGPVASKLKGEKSRRVFLSRWAKVNRIVPDSEVAQIVAKTLEGENISIPYNVVTPSLRAELEKLGVPIETKGEKNTPVANGGEVLYSRKRTQQDADYMAAVERGDMDEAQRMVDEAARAAGYTIKAYHATDASFTVFDKSKSGANTDDNASDVGLAATAHVGYWFNTNDLSENFGGGKAIRSFLKINRPYMAGTVQGLANDILTNAETWAGDFNQLDDQFYEDKKIATEIGEAFQDKLVWDEYDGIELSDEEFGGTSYIIFESNQAKSADSVTYDDRGNVIPLSERFNERNEDIRYSRKRTRAEMEMQLQTLNEEQRRLQQRKRDLMQAPEYLEFMDSIANERAESGSRFAKSPKLSDAIAKYAEWEHSSGLSDISRRSKEVDEEMRTIRNEIERSRKEDLEQARAEYRAKFTPEFAAKYATKAARKFGTTTRFNLAGYLTTNGTLLDFSSRQRTRVTDHREIAEVLDFLPDDHEYSDGMIEFMNLGNIRMQSYGIDIAKAPNAKQIPVLKRFFNSLDGEVTVDFSKENGDSEGSVDYPEGTRAERIINDIKRYFETGKVPELSETAQFHTMYSRKRDSKGRELSEAQARYFEGSKVRDENGRLKPVYHGTSRADRVGTVFLPERATSGPMSFFTDNREIAENYSRDKADTSMAYDEDYDSYETQFRVKVGNRDIPLIKAWGYLPFDARARITEAAGHVREDWDGDGDFIYDPDTNDANGGFQNQLKRGKRNAFWALNEQWLNGGILFNEEEKYLDVLKKIGVFEELKKIKSIGEPYYKNPNYREEKVYEAYLNITNPFDTSTVTEDFVKGFENWYELQDKSRYQKESAGADMWDKNNVSADMFAEQLRNDMENGTTLAWTSIPDSMSDYLKYLEYDGIVDKGGKNGGQSHTVYIPFFSPQIKNVDNEYPTWDRDIRFSRKRGDMARREAQLLRENDILREQIGLLKSEMKRSDTAGRVDPKAVRRAARELIDEYSATVKADEITGDLQRLFDAMGTGKDTGGEVSYESLRELADGVARTIAESALDDTGSLYAEYDELRSFLRNTHVTVTSREIGNFQDWGEWRKEHVGRLNIKRGDTTNIDRVYDELSDRWPEFFPGDVITVEDQIQRMADVADMIYADRGHNPYDPYMDQAVIGIGNDIMERFFDLPEYKTFADKQAAKLAREQIRTSEARQAVKDAKEAGKQAAKDAFLAGQMVQGAAMAGQIRTANARIDKLRAQMSDMRQRNKEAMQRSLDRVRQNRDERLAKQQERFRARTETGRQKQRAAVLRKRIERHASELSQRLRNSTDKKNVPDTLRGPVSALLEAINLESKDRADGAITKRTAAFRELKKQYQEINQDSQNMVIDPDLLGDDAEGFRGLFDRVLDMGETKLYDMSEEQLQTVWKVLRAVEHSVTTYGRNMAMQKYATTAELANNFLRDTKGRRDKSSLGALQGVVLDLENAYTFFDQYGEAGKSIYRMLRNAQDEQRRKLDEVIRLTRNAVDEKAVDKLRKERRQFTTERGDELTLTTAHIMELYLLSRREQALNHLIKGGIVQPEIRKYGKQPKIDRGTEMVLLTQNDLGRLTAMLTPEQMRIADALQAITSDTLAAWGNEASLKAYGYKKFTEKNYWPIKSAAETLHSNVEKDAGNVRSIKNIGMAKNVIPNASNAVSINDVFDTFAGHTADMLDYATWLLPMEDVNRFFNFKFKDADGFVKRTVKQEIDRVGGPNGKASRYWQNLMNDIQNGIDHGRGSDTERIVNRIVGNTKAAAVGGNARVVIQQPTAFFRAAAVMEPESLTKGLVSGVTAGDGWEKAKNWSGIARIKDAGGFDQGSRRSIGTELWNDQTPIDRLNDAMSWAARKADAITWGRLWNAAEWEAKRLNPNLPEGSTEFYRKAAEIFTDTVDQTQVVDGVLQRPQIMRSGDQLTKQMTVFMGEPLMSVNTFLRAWDNVRYENNPASRSKAIKRLGRTAAALAVTDAVNALAQSVVDAWRDDDKDKKYWERFLTALNGITGDEESFKDYLKSVYFGSNFVGNINPLNRLPILKDTQSIMQGFSVERLDASTISDIIQAHNRLWSGKVTLGYGLYRLLGTLAKLRGIPVTNLERDVLGVVRSAVYATGDPVAMWNLERAIYTPSENKGRYYDILELALRNGDTESYETLRERMAQETDKTSKDVDDAVKSRLNKNGGMNRTAAELLGVVEKYNQTSEVKETFSNANLNPSEYTRYSNQKAAMFKEYRGYIENSSEFSGLSPAQKDTAVGWAKSLAEDRALSDNSGGRFQIETDWEQTAIQAQAAGIGIGNYLRFHLVEETSHDDKDANGKTIKGRAKKDKIREWLESQRDLTDGQREWLWSTQYSGEW